MDRVKAASGLLSIEQTAGLETGQDPTKTSGSSHRLPPGLRLVQKDVTAGQMDQQKVAPALGKIASGLYIATALEPQGTPVGMLCSFVEQAGFEPPMITIAIAPDRRLAKALESGSKLGLNVLGKASGGSLMKPFISNSTEDPFTEIALNDNSHGVPHLSDALALLVCERRDMMDAGDHRIYLCEVIDGEMKPHSEKDEPMVRIRSNGFGY